MSTSPIPEGFTSLTPFLCVRDGRAAIEFYVTVFGATVVSTMDAPGGGIAHAELQFEHGRLQLSDAMPEYGLTAPTADPTPDQAADHSTVLYCPDVDAVFGRAVEHGAGVREEPSTFVTGDRFASIIDPYGHRWAILTRVEDVSPEESERRLSEWASTELG